MRYPDGQTARCGDRVRLWESVEGTVVCSLDTGEFSAAYAKAEWDYLRRGVLIHSLQTGLIHYLEPEATFELRERAKPPARASGRVQFPVRQPPRRTSGPICDNGDHRRHGGHPVTCGTPL